METIVAMRAKAVNGYNILGTWLEDFFRSKDIVVFQGSGATVVFGVRSLKTVFKVASTKYPRAFELELYAIKNATFAHKLGFVYAAIVEANSEMISKIPKKSSAKCKLGDPIVSMPFLSGTNVLEVLNTKKKINPQIIARAIVDHIARLKEHKWCNTDLKLENIQYTEDGRVVFLDWGSLCEETCPHPTTTYMIKGKETCAKACASLAAVLTLAELFGMSTPPDHCVTEEFYKQQRGVVMDFLEVPHNQRFKDATLA